MQKRKPGRPAIKKIAKELDKVVIDTAPNIESVPKSLPTICQETLSKGISGCAYYRMGTLTVNRVKDPMAFHQCVCPEAPITGFILGLKECYKINTDGACKFYKPRVNE